MCFQSIHFHRWLEAGLKVNCIMGINVGVTCIFKHDRVRQLAIMEEITSVHNILLCLDTQDA